MLGSWNESGPGEAFVLDIGEGVYGRDLGDLRGEWIWVSVSFFRENLEEARRNAVEGERADNVLALNTVLT